MYPPDAGMIHASHHLLYCTMKTHCDDEEKLSVGADGSWGSARHFFQGWKLQQGNEADVSEGTTSRLWIPILDCSQRMWKLDR
jgi:hypothetical protein